MSTKPIAVLLSTGKQGRNVVKALLNTKSKDKYHIVALTRDPSSEKAQNLLTYLPKSSPNSIDLVQCDVHNKQQLIAIFNRYDVWGVYCNTMYSLSCSDKEYQDGKACIDAAIECNVKFFIHSSVSDAQYAPNDIVLWHTKYKIDQYLHSVANTMQYVSMEIPWNMENLLEHQAPKNGYLQMVLHKIDKKITMIACQNIGDIAAAFFNKDIKINEDHSYICIGDIKSPNEMCQILSNVSNSKVQFTNNMPFYWLFAEKIGIKFVVQGIKAVKYYNEQSVDDTHIQRKLQCITDLGDKMITFEEFAETHFKDKDLSEPITRKIVKYGALLTLIVIIGGLGIKYLKKESE